MILFTDKNTFSSLSNIATHQNGYILAFKTMRDMTFVKTKRNVMNWKARMKYADYAKRVRVPVFYMKSDDLLVLKNKPNSQCTAAIHDNSIKIHDSVQEQNGLSYHRSPFPS